MNKLRELIGKQVLFFDGGTGSVLQSMGLMPGELPEMWNLEHPEKITKLHYDYFASGANIVKTDTFGANPLKFSDDQLSEIVNAAIENASNARKQILQEKKSDSDNLFIALDIGPCGKLIKPLGDISFNDTVEVFKTTIRLGMKAGADCVLIETMNDLYEAKAAVLAAKEIRDELNSDFPIFATTVFDESALTLTGSSPELMVTYLASLDVDALGVNCSLGPEQMVPIVKRILECTTKPVIVNPNAGLPRSENGKTVFDVTPERFAQIVSGFVKDGICFAGGCCGTTPKHIQLLVDETKKLEPALLVHTENTETSVCSNSKIVKIGGMNKPVLIGERINPTGKKRFKQALRDNDLQYIIGEGIKQDEKGCHILDVNVGLPEIDETKMLTHVIYELQSVTELPLQLDTSNPVSMEAALRLYNGKPLINSVNGKQEVMDEIFPLVKKYGGAVIALTLDEGGIPETAEGRIAIARKIIAEAEKYGISKNELIFDPLAMAISSDDKAGIETLKAIKILHEELKAHSSLGVSNVSFGLPNRELITSTFFVMAMQNGLNVAIMNPNSLEMRKAYYTFCTINGMDPQCNDYIVFSSQHDAEMDSTVALLAQAPGTAKAKELTKIAASINDMPFASDTVEYAIVKGLKEKAGEITLSLLNSGVDSMSLINDRLIPALDYVGKNFEAKKMYLPQLLMAAESAKAGFDVIKEKMKDSSDGASANSDAIKIVIATVKGDIHDIGKNIVKVILENYGFNVYDLGKDVPPEAIVEKAIEVHAELVGLSALMTTTVPAMEETIKQLRKSAPWVKVCVGGAVLTQEYADMIGADFYGKDAMATVGYAKSL